MLSVFIKAQACLSLRDQTAVQECALCGTHAWEACILKRGSHVGKCLKPIKCPSPSLTSSSQPRGRNPMQCLWILLVIFIKIHNCLQPKVLLKMIFFLTIYSDLGFSPQTSAFSPKSPLVQLHVFLLSLSLSFENEQTTKKLKRKYTRPLPSY